MSRIRPGVAAVAAGVLLGIVGVALSAQVGAPPSVRNPFPTPSPAQQQPLVFRSRVDLVQVDVSVLDDRRRPVRGLTPEHFTVLEDGQPQKVVAFTEMTASDPDAPPESWLRTVVPDVTVNNAEDGRLLLLVLDDAATPLFPAGARRGGERGPDPTATVKQVARSIVERLGPSDLASVIFTVKNKNEQEFTSDRTRLFAAIDGFSPAQEVENYNAMLAMSTLSDAARVLGSIPHRRKAMILISPMVPPVIPLEIHPGYVREAGEVRLEGLRQDALRWALRGNVTLYNVNPMQLTGLGDEVAKMLGPDAEAVTDSGTRFGKPTSELPPPPRYYDRGENRISGTPLDQLTGGFSVRTSAEFAAGITQIFRESGSYYLLGYSSPTLKDDGKIRRIEVRLNQLPFVVRSRAAFVPPKAEREQGRASPLWTAISGLTPAKDLALRVNVAPFAIPGKKDVALAITMGLRQPVEIGSGPSVPETMTFLTQAFSTNGDRRGSPRYHTVTLDLRPNPAGEVKYEVLSRLDLKPGRYHLRLSATSRALGKSGSIYHDVEIPDFSQTPLSLSGVVLSATPPLTSGPRELLASLLPAVPTSQREFAGHAGSAYLRIYQGGRDPIVPVWMSTRIVDVHDQVLVDSPELIPVERFDRHRAAEVRFELPARTMPPGAYLLVFSASSGRGVAVTREVRFQVTPARDK